MIYRRLGRNALLAAGIVVLLVLARLYLPGPWPWRHGPATQPAIPASGRFYAGVDSSHDGLAAYESAAGVTQPAVLGAYTNGHDGSVAEALSLVSDLPGTIPLLSWGVDITRGAVANGSQDTYLRAQAVAVAAYRKPVFLRLDWEMNGSWYPEWDGTSVSPSAYIAAWRHVWTVFQQAGATNAAFVWCPNVSDLDGQSWTQWYPGSEYVDWIGVDAYPDPTNSQAYVSGPGGLDAFAAFAKGEDKPAMLAEWAPGAPQQDPTATFDLVFSWLGRNPGTVKALVYFNYRNTQRDDLLVDDAAGAARYRQLLQQYRTGLYGTGGLR